jgi:hypothetical protein
LCPHAALKQGLLSMLTRTASLVQREKSKVQFLRDWG